MRGIIRAHFEDDFKSPEQVLEVAKGLKTTADLTSPTVEMLVETGTSSTRAVSESLGIRATTFERVWKVNPDWNDTEVYRFCSWSALLLHLMVHKAFGALFHPLFRDPSMISDGRLRTRLQPIRIVLPRTERLTK